MDFGPSSWIMIIPIMKQEWKSLNHSNIIHVFASGFTAALLCGFDDKVISEWSWKTV